MLVKLVSHSSIGFILSLKYPMLDQYCLHPLPPTPSILASLNLGPTATHRPSLEQKMVTCIPSTKFKSKLLLTQYFTSQHRL